LEANAVKILLILSLAALQAIPQTGKPEDPGYDVPPRVLEEKKASYPEDAYRRGIEGVVMLEYVINADGRVKNAKVVVSVPGLDQAALKAMQKWRFVPAQKDGKPVATKANSPFSFCIVDTGCRERQRELRKR